MARRKAKRRSSPKFKGIRVVPAIEALAQATIWTEATLRVNPFEFLTGITEGVYKPGADGGERITLPELITGFKGGNYASTLPMAIQKNVGGMGGLIQTGVKSIGLSVGFRVLNKFTSKARSSINRQILKPLGVDSFVRF
jgi:hypothetical protein